MNQNLSRFYIIFLVVGYFSLFFATPATRDYAIQAFSGGDKAYHFYDDFPIHTQKSILLFQILVAASLYLIYKASDRKRFQEHRWLEVSLYLFGGILILMGWPCSPLVVTLLFALGFAWNEPEVSRQQNRWLLAAFFIMALLFRLEKLPNVIDHPLQPDSIQYLTYSQETTWFYDTHHREPLWAWVNWGLTRFFPISESVREEGYLPIRLMTILLSSLCVLAVYGFGRRWLSPSAGFAAALLMIANKAFIYRSLQGLRLELLILVMLGFLWISWLPSRSNRLWNRRTLGLGALGSLLLLLRTSCLPIVVFSLIWAAWTRKQTFKQILIAGAICLLPVLPYYYYCWTTYGDPLYSGNAHIRFYFHAVFGEYPPDGVRISPFQFMFHWFKGYESVFYTLLGTAETFVGHCALKLFYVPLSVVFIGVSGVGYIRWIIQRERRLLACSVIILLGPMAFFLGILFRSATVFDWRLVAHLFPFMAYAAFEGMMYLLQQAKWWPERKSAEQ